MILSEVIRALHHAVIGRFNHNNDRENDHLNETKSVVETQLID